MSRVSGLVELVRVMILRGEIPAGERMVELQLAERLRVGRSTVREVLRRLEGQGLLVENESGGMRVVSLGLEELVDTLRVRAALEALSASLAAQRVKEGDMPPAAVHKLDALAEAADVSARTDDLEAAVISDRNFHRAADALAANGPCHAALDRLWDRIIVATLQSVTRPEGPRHVDREHHELLVAIAAGDAEGASAVACRHALPTFA